MRKSAIINDPAKAIALLHKTYNRAIRLFKAHSALLDQIVAVLPVGVIVQMPGGGPPQTLIDKLPDGTNSCVKISFFHRYEIKEFKGGS